MIEQIKQKLAEVAEKHNITILYACESGSRAWGFPSPDSDWDVRFIYIRNLDWYLSIKPKKDFLDFPINDELDLNGWDISKTLGLFAKSNPVVFEWLQSPIVYSAQNGFSKRMMSMADRYFSAKSSLYHYLGITANSFKPLQENAKVKLKKYFYTLRSLFSALWIVEKGTVPPMEFSALRVLLEDSKLNVLIDEMLETKSKSDETYLSDPVPAINEYVSETIEYCGKKAENFAKKYFSADMLDAYFRELLDAT